MKVTALKAFPYAHDGLTSQVVGPGEIEVRDELAPGLAAEGYIDGAPHGLPLLSAGRRAAMTDTILATMRAELDALDDADLAAMAHRFNQRAAELADRASAEAEADAAAQTAEAEPAAEAAAEAQQQPEAKAAAEQPAQAPKAPTAPAAAPRKRNRAKSKA